ncbi:DUF1993 domain-containing protein [Aurantiacibacter xanthus]|uniref:DUF1993 domain-containing protein n=1 Tax=Aurantiacibacter xanthus TaxID=1784712 RepID=A0A3A1P4H5_9SPHN|nr:DUF1993 domain-containing protein [Aurantiacibacter xanthus]RIV80860.1 DUF1993 domain-containing protein [Aurantiacibacter xanthus]
MNLADILAPTYIQMLGAMSAWLGKAAEQLPEADSLMSKRLANDMFPLATQVRFSCVQALEGLCRLRGEDFPPLVDELLNEGRNAGEQPGTIVEARARIEQVLAEVRKLAEDVPVGDDDRPIEHALPMGLVFDLSAEQYTRDWALAQFYFHVMIAYAILRAGGVDLGKADYVAHMFQYVRPGTMPGA